MQLLRLHQSPGTVAGRYQFELTADDIPGFQRLTHRAEIALDITDQDRKDIRWYLEEYLEFDQDPAPAIAQRVEDRMTALGEALFYQIFEGTGDASRFWGVIEPHLGDMRIEIATGIDEATAIPWELIREPRLNRHLALSARAFVRTQHGAPATLAPASGPDKVRILLVICRPRADKDVPFRSVAGRLVTRLAAEARDALDLDVLRPPNFQRLGEVLRQAHADDRPYHIVHFDGHGTYAEREALKQAGAVFSNTQLKDAGSGRRGFLVFEDEESDSRSAYVDGFRLGNLLRETGVPLLILNACQSAFAEASSEPEGDAAENVREEIQAYGSLAQAVVDAGSAGVVAMRYAVYVETAASFVLELYGALAHGRTLGAAVSVARKHLAAKPARQIAHEPRPLQDWSVPIVWEQTPIRLWPERSETDGLVIRLEEDPSAKAGGLDPKLPPTPDLGFFGRDETLYALDRAFDRHDIVLLHAYAGSGKTTTAAEFARWFSSTGGLDGAGGSEGPVLFTSFERHLPLARVLDKVGEIFGPSLEASGIQWGAITDDAKRREITLQVLSQVPVLWIWDNVEPVTGFPSGSKSAWSGKEQQELVDFLRVARETKAKFLLTSRRSELAWLGELPCRIMVPSMPMRERFQLTGGILERRGKRLQDFPDLKPLLRWTQGNPLTILVIICAAFRADIDSEIKLETFVERLRRGEAEFEDEASEGRSKSLGASLAYGFEGFSPQEKKVLALLHLFQGVVNAGMFSCMGMPEENCSLNRLHDLTLENCVDLLGRAAEIGLLSAHGHNYYRIHPALSWFFHGQFERYYPDTSGELEYAGQAFADGMSTIGHLYHKKYFEGRREYRPFLCLEEDNFLATLHLARRQGWGECVIGVMQGLNALYMSSDDNSTWRRLVETIVPEFIDLTDDGPLSGREEHWSIVTSYRVKIARQEGCGAEAERLQQLQIDLARKQAETLLALPGSSLDEIQKGSVRSLAYSFFEAAQIQREQLQASCVEGYEEARKLCRLIDDRAFEATVVLNLGHAYKNLSSIRDLDAAAQLYREGLAIGPDCDNQYRAKFYASLGSIAYERFSEARDTKADENQLSKQLDKAVSYYNDSLELLPDEAINDLGGAHFMLGSVYGEFDIDSALLHLQQAVRYAEAEPNTYLAGAARMKASRCLAIIGRLVDAQAYAEAAITNLAACGDQATEALQQSRELLDTINKAIVEQGDTS